MPSAKKGKGKPSDATIDATASGMVVSWTISEPPPQPSNYPAETTTWWVGMTLDNGVVISPRQTGDTGGSFDLGQVGGVGSPTGGTIRLWTSQQVANGQTAAPVDEDTFTLS